MTLRLCFSLLLVGVLATSTQADDPNQADRSADSGELAGDELVGEELVGEELVGELNTLAESLPTSFELKLTSAEATHGFLTSSKPTSARQNLLWDNGLHHALYANREMIELSGQMQFKLTGDFDIRVAFDGFESRGEGNAGIALAVDFGGSDKRRCQVMRLNSKKGVREATALSDWTTEENQPEVNQTRQRCDFTAGELRLLRRDDTVYFLISGAIDSDFELIGTHVLGESTPAVKSASIRIFGDGNSRSNVRWTVCSLRAETLDVTHQPQKEKPRKKYFERGIGVLNLDSSSEPKVLSFGPDDLSQVGSPEWSSDGKRITFDASKGSVQTSRICVINADGSGLKDLGEGCMPSFSPDGKRIVFTNFPRGILMMNDDGSDRVVLDADGWGKQWSPGDDELAWARRDKIIVYNVATKQRRSIDINTPKSLVSYVYWNFAWSNDGKWIAFKAIAKDGGQALAVVSTAVPTDSETEDSEAGDSKVEDDRFHEVRTLYHGRDISHNVTWDGKGRRVLFTFKDDKTSKVHLLAVDIESGSDQTPTIARQSPEDWRLYDADVSVDGKKIAVSASVPVDAD